MREYVTLSTCNGATCCLYVGSAGLFITREVGFGTIYNAPLQDIGNLGIEGNDIVITLKNNDRWRMRSDRQRIVVEVINELLGQVRNAQTRDISSEESQVPEGQGSEWDSHGMLLDRQERQTGDSLIEVFPGISAIRCPNPEEGNEWYDIEAQFQRDFKIPHRLGLPEEAVTPKREVPIPDLRWFLEMDILFSLKQKPARILICLVALLGLFASMAMGGSKSAGI
jgi:hypothetical protein